MWAGGVCCTFTSIMGIIILVRSAPTISFSSDGRSSFFFRRTRTDSPKLALRDGRSLALTGSAPRHAPPPCAAATVAAVAAIAGVRARF
jgi:hypothetical protein